MTSRICLTGSPERLEFILGEYLQTHLLWFLALTICCYGPISVGEAELNGALASNEGMTSLATEV